MYRLYITVSSDKEIEKKNILSYWINMYNPTRNPCGKAIWHAHARLLCVCVHICGLWFPGCWSCCLLLIKKCFYASSLSHSASQSTIKQTLWDRTVKRRVNKSQFILSELKHPAEGKIKKKIRSKYKLKPSPQDKGSDV